ncbi:MAG: septum formation protein Maf [Clostridia bacterium]|nr:septum formation protein Maf [Clostridia bacterium]MBQ7604268.1 septum formation protein Maf [Clostridia bacterium]
MAKLILASGSPRRRELLERQNIDFEVVLPEVDEGNVTADSPDGLVRALSALKCSDVSARVGDGIPVVAADTVVEINGGVLGKPKDEADARIMLHTLSGNSHLVHSGVTVSYKGVKKTVSVTTKVFFRELGDDEIENYIASGEPLDKAGSYGIQERGALFVNRIEGDFYNVMGFPVCEFFSLLRTGFRILPDDLRKQD